MLGLSSDRFSLVKLTQSKIIGPKSWPVIVCFPHARRFAARRFTMIGIPIAKISVVESADGMLLEAALLDVG